MKYIEKVLVLGSDSRSFLSVVRSLGRQGIEVHIAWHHPESVARYSKYIKKQHNLPEYAAENENWLNALSELLLAENYDLVIPCDDPSIIPLHLQRDYFCKITKIYLLEKDIYEIVNNKDEVSKIIKQLNISMAAEKIVEKGQNISELIDFFSFPVILKPTISFEKNNLKDRLYVKTAFNPEELKTYLDEIPAGKSVLAQKYFSGVGCGVEILAKKGDILTVFQHERVHEPLLGGGSTYRKSVPVNEELFAATEKLIHYLGYTGVAMVEFKINKETGEWIFIEINPRFWGSLPLAVAAGVDFPWYLYKMLVRNDEIIRNTYQVDVFCRNLVMDIEWMRANLSSDHSNPYLHTVPMTSVLTEYLNILKLKEKHDTFQFSDPMPGVLDVVFFTKRILKSAVSKVFGSQKQ